MEAILATADGQLEAALKMAQGIADQCDESGMPGVAPIHVGMVSRTSLMYLGSFEDLLRCALRA